MPQQRRVYPLIAGGILALTMLIRIQVVLLLPGVLLVIMIAFWARKKQFAVSALLFLVGMACVLIPWLWRGQQTSGSLSFAEAAQESQIGLIGVRYSLNLDPALGATLPGESSSQYSKRMLSRAIDFIRSHPFEALEFITAHLLHNQISTLMTLPPNYASAVPVPYLETKLSRTWEACCSIPAYIGGLPYWMKWDGRFPDDAPLPLVFNLLLVSVGLGAAWKHNRFLGLLPVWISFCYALGNSVVRSSGWRFNLPVDWVGLFYYAIGMVQIITWGAMFFVNRVLPINRDTANDGSQPSLGLFPWKQAIVLGALFFLTSAAIPISEAAILPRYSDDWLGQALADTQLRMSLQQAGLRESISDFAMQNGMKLVYGRALYPRYYGSKQGIPGDAWFAFVPRDYARLGF